MKSRPRYAENRIAKELTDILGAPFERIPVLGRTGPDLTVNSTQLVIDVKSRKSCPKTYFCKGMIHKTTHHCSVALSDLQNFAELPAMSRHYSIIVGRWLDHMHAWTIENVPNGITALIIHRPGMPYGESRLIFYHSDIGNLMSLLRKEQQQ